jgi:hypothetical protein
MPRWQRWHSTPFETEGEAEADFPYRFVQVVREEENWRGTWVLEVKDVKTMGWESEFVPDKTDRRGGQWVLKAAEQFPFGVEGLMLMPEEEEKE